jgi:glycerol-3-phosphate cytidylyltransferase
MKTGITFSAFDLMHTGHSLMLKECKENCDYLIVGLLTDPTIDRPFKNKPVQTLFERYILLRSNKYVDEVIPYSTEKELEQILLSIKLDVRFIGEDYIGKDFTGKDICLNNNIEIFFNKRKHSFSSTELRKKIIDQNILDLGKENKG